MKTTVVKAVLAVLLLATGCGKKTDPPRSAQSTETPIAQRSMMAWQRGDKPTAIRSFVETDWSHGTLFASDSALSLTEDQFKALSNADQQAKYPVMMSQLDSLKELAAAVAQAGRDAISSRDSAQAWEHFASLKQCGTALDRPDSLLIMRLVGQVLKKQADAELAKIP